MGARKESGQDTELAYWRNLFPDARRDADGQIHSDLWEQQRVGGVFDDAQFADQIADAANLNNRTEPPVKKKKKGRSHRPPRSNDEWGQKIQFLFEIPGSDLKIQPLGDGKGRGWRILRALKGENLSYTWPCGCKEVDGMYYACGKGDACEV